MSAFLLRLSILSALLLPSGESALAQTPLFPEPAVQVRQQDSSLIMDISYQVPVPPQEAWATLTDFENQPAFMPNLEVSRVLQRSGNRLQIEQKGAAKLGIFSFHYESQRELEITPYQLIRSHSLSGNIRMESTLALIPSGTGGTRIAYHVIAVPNLPLPTSLIASYLSGMLRDQFKAIGREMLRRTKIANNSGQQAMALN
ncbi:MAG TPA: SRPBCC family protein [Thiobacillaceae bacterium]|nr:SRPBCC family protein [Thiobacillaceae bacterium]